MTRRPSKIASGGVPGHIRRARLGVSLMFFSNGFIFSNLAPRLPLLKAQFELSHTAFGFLMIVAPLASLLPGSLAARLIRRFGALPVNLVGTIGISTGLVLVGWSGSLWFVGLGLAMMGFFDNITDAGQNVQGLMVEDGYGKSIFNSLHGMWSLGAASGGLVGALAAGHDFALHWHLTLAALAAIVMNSLAVGLAALPGSTPEDEAAADLENDQAITKVPRWAFMAILPLVCLGISGVMVEDIGERWSALYLLEQVGVGAGVAGLGYPVLIGSQFVGRFVGDPLVDRFGRVKVLRTGGLLILSGALLLVILPHPATVFIGLSLCGFGCATTVPAAYAAAGRLPGLPKGAGIALLGWGFRAGFLGTSPIFGFISDVSTMRAAMGLLILSGVGVTLLASQVRDQQARD